MNASLYTLKRLRNSRRVLAAALAASVAAAPFLATLMATQAATHEQAIDALTVTPAQLQSVVEQGFPREEEWLGGVATLTLSRPRIAIPLEQARIHLDLDYRIEVSLDGREEQGQLRVASGLRYNPATRGLHLQNPELLDLRNANRDPAVDEQTRGLINALLQDYAKDEPVYRLDAAQLAQIPGNPGADAIRIEGGNVHLRLAP